MLYTTHCRGPLAYIIHGFGFEVSGLIVAKATVGRGMMLWKGRLRGMWMLVCLPVLVHVCERESKNKTDRKERGREGAQIKNSEENKSSSSWENIYHWKVSHCGKTSPFFIKAKWNLVRDMAPWREAKPKPEHPCVNKYDGELDVDSDTQEMTWKDLGDRTFSKKDMILKPKCFYPFLRCLCDLVIQVWKFRCHLFHCVVEWMGGQSSQGLLIK